MDGCDLTGFWLNPGFMRKGTGGPRRRFRRLTRTRSSKEPLSSPLSFKERHRFAFSLLLFVSDQLNHPLGRGSRGCVLDGAGGQAFNEGRVSENKRKIKRSR